MSETIAADASPEKRLFISLLTRDIPLISAFLDLIDNSVNAAAEQYADRLRSAQGYERMLNDPKIKPRVRIDICLSRDRVSITDTAGGISAKTAQEHIFKFGRSLDETHPSDRLSVYGIGLKRAIFKLGNKVEMRSEHKVRGFDLNLDVKKWEIDETLPWEFRISERQAVAEDKTGTRIAVTELYDDVMRRLNDGIFEGQLREAISRTYAFYLAKLVIIAVNGKEIESNDISVGENRSNETFERDGVSCAIGAGLGMPDKNGMYRAATSGWFVFCNGRAVVTGDKSILTGWGGASGLPIFQPKHRPFFGTVYFVSGSPELLPWTTTKSGLNEDSLIWQEALRKMHAIAKSVISFLDSRYTDEGTEVSAEELRIASGSKSLSSLNAATAAKRSFKAPKAAKSMLTRIQYDANVSDIEEIAVYLKKPSMSGSEVGRHTFTYFLRNEVGIK